MARLLERVLGVSRRRRRPARGAGRPPRRRSGWTRPRSVPFLGPLIGVPATPEYPAPGTRPERLPRRDPRPARGVGVRARAGRRRTCSWSRTCTGPTRPRSASWAGSSTGSRPACSRWRPPGTRPPSPGPGRSHVLELGRLDGAAASRLIDNLVAGQDAGRRPARLRRRAGRGDPALHRGADPLLPRRHPRRLDPAAAAGAVHLRASRRPASTCASSRSPPPWARPSTPAIVSAVIGDDDGRRPSSSGCWPRTGIIEPVGARGRHLPLPPRPDARRRLRDPGPRRAPADPRRRGGGASPARGARAGAHRPAPRPGRARPSAPPASTSSPPRRSRAAGRTPRRPACSRGPSSCWRRLPESDERDLSELTARMLRALSTSSMRGYAAPEVQSDHRRAEVLADRPRGRPEVLPSLIAIWAYWLVHGDLATARGLIDRLTRHGRSARVLLVRAGGDAPARAAQEFYRGRRRRRPRPTWSGPWRASPPAPPSRRSPRSGRCPTTPSRSRRSRSPA